MPRARDEPTSAKIHNALRARVTNTIVMVPDTDWSRVIAGEKQMFRSYSRRVTPAILPTPVVAYRIGLNGGAITKVLWLEDTWQEPLGTITDADLAAEGFATLSDFRRYIEQRYPKGGYRPLAPVQVYRIRPITDEDRVAFAHRLMEYLGYA